MAVALREFWSRLVRAGITEASGCKQIAAAFSETHSGSPPDSAEALVQFLVSSGVLSDYQASRLLGEEEPRLRLGGFVVRSDQPIRPLSHWIPAQTVVREEGQAARRGFLLRVPLTALDATMQTWLRLHAKSSGPCLQGIELSGGASAEDVDKTVEIFSPLPSGQSLWQRLSGTSGLSPKHVLRIGIDVASALATMHDTQVDGGAPLAHGAVGCDSIWITDKKGEIVLLRDPSRPPSTPHHDPALSWIERIEPVAAYAAPELASPGIAATPAADIYSLGCVLYTALLGSRPFAGTESEKLFPQHRFEVPDALRQATEQGADGDPILRVLAYAMAKDPKTRFQTAQAFGDALRKVEQLMPSSDSSLAMRKVVAKPEAPSSQPESKAKPTKTPSATVTSKASGKQATPAADQTSLAREPAASNAVNKNAAPPKTEQSKSKKRSQRKKARESEVSPSVERASKVSPSAAPPIEATASTADNSPASAPPPPPDPSEPPVAEPPIVEAPITEPPVSSSIVEPSAIEASGDADAAPPTRRRRKRKKNRLPILAGMMVVPMLMLGLAIALRGRGPQKPKPRPRPTASAITNVPKVAEARREQVDLEPTKVNGYSIVESDRLLWVPPFDFESQPPSLELLPPGPAGIVSVSLSRLQESADWAPLRTAFQAEVASLTALAASRAGVSESNIRRCTVALFPGKTGWPEVTLAIELADPVPIKTLTDAWKAFESRTPEGA
ncbi:MAG: hypothetical protein AAFX06_32635, partial [Planctomycetota bacterium]